jgi:hypothetical protein
MSEDTETALIGAGLFGGGALFVSCVFWLIGFWPSVLWISGLLAIVTLLYVKGNTNNG